MKMSQAFLEMASTLESLVNKHRSRKLLSLYNLIACVAEQWKNKVNSEMWKCLAFFVFSSSMSFWYVDKMWKVLVPHLVFCYKLFLNVFLMFLVCLVQISCKQVRKNQCLSLLQNYLHDPIHVQIVERLTFLHFDNIFDFWNLCLM